MLAARAACPGSSASGHPSAPRPAQRRLLAVAKLPPPARAAPLAECGRRRRGPAPGAIPALTERCRGPSLDFSASTSPPGKVFGRKSAWPTAGRRYGRLTRQDNPCGIQGGMVRFCFQTPGARRARRVRYIYSALNTNDISRHPAGHILQLPPNCPDRGVGGSIRMAEGPLRCLEA